MALPERSSELLLHIMLTLGQLPILANRIRGQMRHIMQMRGIIDTQTFENRVRMLSIDSQHREGLSHPEFEEPEDLWEMRQSKIRDSLTDLTFSKQFTEEEFNDIVAGVLSSRGLNPEVGTLALNPEMAPLDMVFEQAATIDSMSAEARQQYLPRYQESKVVLIRGLISDQLRYINIAKEWLPLSDLLEIRRRKIGAGRIGGKAAGMMLAGRILKDSIPPDLNVTIKTPDTYFIGATQFYLFMSVNGLMHWIDQKYKTEAQMRQDFPVIEKQFKAGIFPDELVNRLVAVLRSAGKKPLIVRSSSLLEDNFGTAFAGKYESVFLPNQGTLHQNLTALKQGIAQIYASAYNPNALLYRRQRGLQDYDERMAILLQVVEGDTYGDYYMPHGAGVGFSRNTFRWSPQIRPEEGFLRLVWGLGTRAVDRVGNDFPRLVALSHPTLQPSNTLRDIHKYTQHYVDLIDLKANKFVTKPVKDVVDAGYPPLRYIFQLESEGGLSTIRSTVIDGGPERLLVTFDELLRRSAFPEVMKQVLQKLEDAYAEPVDMEFALRILEPTLGQPHLEITVLQCRPQSRLEEIATARLPENLPREDLIFATHFVVPKGYISRVKWVVYVPYEEYFALSTFEERRELARLVGKLNEALKDEPFICVGPGRWGSSNADLGVPVDYGDIYNAKALVELAGKMAGAEPEPSLGTHFFQDLLESQIYPLAINIDAPDTVFDRAFFYDTPNRVESFVSVKPNLARSLRLINVEDYRAGAFMRIAMDDNVSTALAYLVN